MHYYRGSTIVPIIITLLLVIVAAVVAAFFLWPVPEPKNTYLECLQFRKMQERIQYAEKVELRWEAVLNTRPRQPLAEVFAGKSKIVFKLPHVVSDLPIRYYFPSLMSLRLTCSQYWWKVRVYTEGGKSAESEIWTFRTHEYLS